MNTKTLVAGILAAFLLAVPASAHCGHGGYRQQTSQPVATAYPACTVDGCTIAGHHLHNGTTYCVIHHESGVCGVGCLTSACPTCTVDGCNIAGRHLHDGVTYCGTYHADGVCNVNCLPAATVVSNATVVSDSSSATTSGSTGYYGGHHGGGHHRGHC